jgi:hypothetical protein
VHHPRYATEFRKFGQRLLAGEDVDFLREFSGAADQLTDDHRRFLEIIRSKREIPRLTPMDDS